MIALLIAAGLSAHVPGKPVFWETPALTNIPARCQERAERARGEGERTFRRLGDLPPPLREYAVMRKVDGCMVAAPMGYHPRPAEPETARP